MRGLRVVALLNEPRMSPRNERPAASPSPWPSVT